MWDILVRPEDLPQDLRGIVSTLPDAGTVAPGPSVEGAGALQTTVLCELPWDDAWRLTERLIGSGIPAAVMAAEEPDRDRPMGARAVPVGVRPEDLERARAFLD